MAEETDSEKVDFKATAQDPDNTTTPVLLHIPSGKTLSGVLRLDLGSMRLDVDLSPASFAASIGNKEAFLCFVLKKTSRIIAENKFSLLKEIHSENSGDP